MPSTNRFVIAIALATILAAAPIGASHSLSTPDPTPQDCWGNTDINGDGIGYYHHYVGIAHAKLFTDITPVEIDEGTPGVTFGDGQDDRVFAEVVVRDGSQDACPDEPDPVNGPRGVGHRDGEFEWGLGGVWLNMQHHWGYVCAVDDHLVNVEFEIGSDVDGDGFAEETQSKATSCEIITVPYGVGPAGRGAAGPQEGWWVYLQSATTGHVWTTNTGSPVGTPAPPCGADELIGPKGTRRAGGPNNQFTAGAVVGIKVGEGRVLVAEGVTQTGGPAGNPGLIQEVPHAGMGEGTVHTWKVSASRDFKVRTYSYAFTTSCPADGSFATYSGKFYVYN